MTNPENTPMTTTNEGGKGLTEYEAKIYDRSIRLWGVDAQAKLRQSKVLFIGINGLMSEIIKNVVLAGVDSITLVDDHIITTSDLSAHLFINEDSVGKVISTESVFAISELNPLVTIDVYDKEIETMDDQFIKNYTMVVISDKNLNNVSKVNSLCRKNNVSFIFSHSFGLKGLFFSDLNEFKYFTKTTTEPPKTETHISIFKSFKESMGYDWSKTNSRTPLPFFALSTLYQFEEKHNRVPDNISDSDLSELKSIINSSIEKFNLKNTDSNKYFEETKDLLNKMNIEISPVCAIVGGIVGAEIIKIITQNMQVLNNFFFYDGVKGTGLVEQF
ncbi:sumo-activating enzyme subunit 1 [Dictyostelium discoideum AX4]|uniref:SUMO-activating enzyme subunit 1 n=1 Tax=Dictyostelium discoideum TaxID=44689 RepID=SAE1_DICDI|nr:sumo-activating enzyme subunit 1 [Dictyostelium discoideum AX4]Q54WI4.1 RecName: Full=SUMO-activating enzyme subunit 1; AltName: Full=Ubiquitin-like 1-activating enzyme E1A [Dictyostelium discoideum]EAL67595.1 sumo-activating enzyme subunit 1 [Dictyostelium discoideum AX4]|eukprot:XP_641569.1 sumo-activating enzyme subunit 1 [Dictyostelium discoideum AX4]